jgi:anti-sigma B factor antagonist
MGLEIREETVGAVRVLALNGRLDTETSADLELAVQDLLQAGECNFVLDLGGVGYVSSAGLRVLLMLGKAVDGKGSLRLTGLNPTVRQVFDVAGFTPLFAIFPDRAAALGGVPVPAPGSALASAAARLLGATGTAGNDDKAKADLVARSARALGVDPES